MIAPSAGRQRPLPRPHDGSRRLTAAYVYRAFNDEGSIPSLFKRDAERLSEQVTVVALCASRRRAEPDGEVRFLTVEPTVNGSGRVGYALECASFARRADATLRRLAGVFDVVVSEGFATTLADLVRVHAVAPAEIDHYFRRVEPRATLRRRLSPALFRPQIGVVRSIERRLFARRPLCVVPTRRIAAQLRQWYGVPPQLVHVVPYGVDASVFAPDPAARRRLRGELGVPDGRLVALIVGADLERKGLPRALAGIAAGAVDAELWAIGDTDSRGFAELALRLGLSDRLRLLGRRTPQELPAWYQAADVFVLPSAHDTAPLTVLEALASGLPVVASEYAGAVDFVADGVDGLLVRGAGEPDALGAALRLLADPEVRARMATQARARGLELDRTRLFPRFAEAVREAAARRAAAAAALAGRSGAPRRSFGVGATGRP